MSEDRAMTVCRGCGGPMPPKQRPSRDPDLIDRAALLTELHARLDGLTDIDGILPLVTDFPAAPRAATEPPLSLHLAPETTTPVALTRERLAAALRVVDPDADGNLSGDPLEYFGRWADAILLALTSTSAPEPGS